MLGDFGIEIFFRYIFPSFIYGALIAVVYFFLYKAGNRFERLYAYLVGDDGRRISRLAFVIFVGVFLYGFWWIIAHRYHPMVLLGDAATYNQMLYSATHGHLFSESMGYPANGYYSNISYFYYGSSNAINLYLTPLLIGSWAYLLWPQSPMHLIIAYVYIMLFGGISLYYIAHKITGSRATAAYLLVLFALLPQMHVLALTTSGVFDMYSVPFLLWSLFFLHTGRFAWFVLFAALTFFIGIFTQYIVIVLTLGGYWLHRDKRYLWLAAIFILFNILTYAVFDAARFCLSVLSANSAHTLGALFLKFDQALVVGFLGESITLAVYILYICPLLFFAFSKNRFSMVLLAAIAPVFMLVALRKAGHVENHHNHDIVIMLFFLYAVYLKDGLGEIPKMQAVRLATAQVLVFFAVPFCIVVFPLGKYTTFMLNKQSKGVVTATASFSYNYQMDGSLRDTQEALERMIPKDASLCALTSLGNGALFSNRHSFWLINEVKTPRCQFYVLQNNIDVFTDPHYNGNEIPVASLSRIWGNDLYTIYRNANSEDIPYPHWVMGFAFLKNFGRTDCPQDAQSIVPPLTSR